MGDSIKRAIERIEALKRDSSMCVYDYQFHRAEAVNDCVDDALQIIREEAEREVSINKIPKPKWIDSDSGFKRGDGTIVKQTAKLLMEKNHAPSDIKLRECPDETLMRALDAKAETIEPDNDDGYSCGRRMLSIGDAYDVVVTHLRHTDKLLEMAAEGLRFYADEIRYMRVHRCADSGGSYAGNDLDFDKGKRANETLITLQQHGYGKE